MTFDLELAGLEPGPNVRFERAVLAAAELLVEEIDEDGAHVFFDDFEIKFFGEGSVPPLGDPRWREVGSRAASVLATRPQHFAVLVPLANLTGPPADDFDLEKATGSDDELYWGYPGIYYLKSSEGPRRLRDENWWKSLETTTSSIESWVEARRDDDVLPEEPANPMYRVSLVFDVNAVHR